jgi:hypothetical protein
LISNQTEVRQFASSLAEHFICGPRVIVFCSSRPAYNG